MIGICLAVASVTVFIPVERFTLAWMHSIEKVRWEEDYRVEQAIAGQSALVLVPTAARIKGSAAGMEPPPDARLRNGWYEYTPSAAFLSELPLARSDYTQDYDLCMNGSCQKMSAFTPGLSGPTVITACRR